MQRLVGRFRHNVLFGQHLDPVGRRLQQSKGPDSIGAVTILHPPQRLSLQNRGQGEAGSENRHQCRDDQQHRHQRLKGCGRQPRQPMLRQHKNLVQRFHGVAGTAAAAFLDFIVVFVGFRQVVLVQRQAAVAAGALEDLVHFDRVKRADFRADAALHAHGSVDVEHLGVELHLAEVIGLLGGVLDDLNAMGGAFLLADRAGRAAQPSYRIAPIIDQERDRPSVGLRLKPLLGVLHRRQTLRVIIAPAEIPPRLHEPLQYAKAQHQRSTSPSTISMLPRMMTTSYGPCTCLRGLSG